MIIYNVRRIWRLSPNECIVTYIPRHSTRVLTDGIFVLRPFIENAYVIKWTVSKFDEKKQRCIRYRKKRCVIDLKERNFAVSSLCRTKDFIELNILASFNYQIPEIQLQNIVSIDDPTHAVGTVCEQLISDEVSAVELEKMQNNWTAVATSILTKLKSKVAKQSLCLYVRSVQIEVINYITPLRNVHAEQQFITKACESFKKLKKKYTDIDDTALALILLQFTNVKEE